MTMQNQYAVSAILPFPDTIIRHGETIIIDTQPDMIFRPLRFVVDPLCAPFFSIHRIQLANIQILDRPVPGTLFLPYPSSEPIEWPPSADRELDAEWGLELLHTQDCLNYAALTGKAYCIDACAQSRRTRGHYQLQSVTCHVNQTIRITVQHVERCIWHHDCLQKDDSGNPTELAIACSNRPFRAVLYGIGLI